MRENRDISTNNNTDDKQKIILFNNSPIGKSEDDVFDSRIKAQAIKKAINEGANTIALIGEYGSGKSSLTNILYDKNKDIFLKPIYINLWDCVCKQEKTKGYQSKENDDNKSRINSFTKSFLYQFAAGYEDKYFSTYINQRLSKNYGKLSLTTSGWKGTKVFLGIAFFLIVVLFMGFNSLNIHIQLWKLNIPNEIFLFLCIPCIWLTLKHDDFLFSLWDSQGKIEPSDTDVFEIFKEIVTKLKTKNKKRLIIIEDLDRTDDATVVVFLLKELYRFIYLLSDEERGKFIFIVSLKSEQSLVAEDALGSQTENNDMYREGLNIYSKIFDYTVWIRPLHFENVREIIKNLLEPHFSTEEVNSIVSQLYWIMQGESLSIREIKDRLNETFLLHSSLKNRDFSKNSVVYNKCAVVVYLQRQYPRIFQQLIQKEKYFSKCINDYYFNNIKPKLSKSDFVKISDNELNIFSNDFEKMLEYKDIENDYAMYFYNYPANAYINTLEEKKVYDAIIKNDILFIQNEDHAKIVHTVVTEKYGKVIKDACDELVGYKHFYDTVVFESEEIFEIAFNSHREHVIQSIENFIKKEIEEISSTVLSISKICSYSCIKNNESYHNKLIVLLLDATIKKYRENNDKEFIESFRRNVLKCFSKKTPLFKEAFINKNFPIIEIATLGLIEEKNDIFNCLNFQLLTLNNYTDYFFFLERQDFPNEGKQKLIENIKLIPGLENLGNIGINLKKILMKNKIFDKYLFEIIFNELKSNEKKEIIDYIQSIDYVNLAKEQFEAIDSLNTKDITDIRLIEVLEKYNLFTSAIYSRLVLSKFDGFDFTAEWIKGEIKNIGEKIFIESPELINNLRFEFIKHKQLENIYLLFNSPFPYLLESEIMQLDISDLYWATDFSRLQCGTIGIYAKYCNTKKLQSDELFTFFEVLFLRDNKITNVDIINALLSQIDFSICCFDSIGKEKQDKIIEVLTPILQLNDYNHALCFIQKIKCNNDPLDKLIQANISSGEDMFSEYIQLCNSIQNPSDCVLDFIHTQVYEYALSVQILEKFFDKKYFVSYIIGKSLSDNRVFYNYNIPLKEYYNAYCKSNKYYELIKNSDLIEKFYEMELYDTNLNDNKIKPFMKFRQTYKLLKLTLAILQSNDERKKYIQEISHIDTYEDSKKFIILITDEPYLDLFYNDDQFKNVVKEKLWEKDPHNNEKKGVLKRRFTALLNKKLLKKYGNTE